MIAKATNGKSFYGLLKYLLDEEKLPELLSVTGNLRFKDDPGVLSRDMIATSRLNARNETKPVWHFSLAFSSEDSPKLDDDLFQSIAEDFSKLMEFSTHKTILIKHEDTVHPHVHLVVNRINEKGKALPDKMLKKRAMKAAQQLEEKYQLTKAKARSRSVILQVRPLAYAFKPKKEQLNRDIKRIVKQSLNHSESPNGFYKILGQANLSIGPFSKDGESSEVVFADYTYFNNQSKQYETERARLHLSSIERGLTHSNLNERLVPYQLSIDEKNAIAHSRNHYLKKDDVNGFVTSCLLQGVPVQYESVKKVLIRVTEDPALKESIRDRLDHLYLGGAELKRQVLKGDYVIDPEQIFHFTKKECEIIGEDKLDNFYDRVFDQQNIESTIGTALLKVKRVNSDTLYFYANQTQGSQVNYDPLKVDYTAIKNSLLLDNKKELAESMNTDLQHLLNAVQNFKKYKTKDYDVISHLAKRGFRLLIENSNIFVTNEKGEKITQATKVGLDELKRHGELLKSLGQASLNALFDKDFIAEDRDIYRSLDRMDSKEVRRLLSMPRNKVFKLDGFDRKFIDESFGKVISESIEIHQLRTQSTYKNFGKRRR